MPGVAPSPIANYFLPPPTIEASTSFTRNRASDTRRPTPPTTRETFWPIASHSCDLILATETLEHVLDPPTFLSEARRCLRAGGWLVLTMPFAARWHFIPYDYWRMTPSGIDHLLRSSGFGETRVFARGNAGTVACYKVMAILLPLLLPSSASVFVRWISRLAAVPCIPVLILLAAAGNLTLRASGGDDCLGYTVLAQRGID